MSIAMYYLHPLFLILECVILLDPWILWDPGAHVGSLEQLGYKSRDVCGGWINVA